MDTWNTSRCRTDARLADDNGIAVEQPPRPAGVHTTPASCERKAGSRIALITSRLLDADDRLLRGLDGWTWTPPAGRRGYSYARLRVRAEPPAVDELDLQRGEEAPRDGVIQTRPGASHRPSGAQSLARVGECGRGVFRAAVGVHDHTIQRVAAAGGDRCLQGVTGETRRRACLPYEITVDAWELAGTSRTMLVVTHIAQW